VCGLCVGRIEVLAVFSLRCTVLSMSSASTSFTSVRSEVRSSADTVCVATWNLWSSSVDLSQRMASAALLLADVDVLMMQESVLVSGVSSAALLAELAGFPVCVEASSEGIRCAVLSRLPLLGFEEVPLSPSRPDGLGVPFLPAMSVLLAHPSGRRLRAVSAHLAWGSLAEGVRLRQAVLLADHLDRVVAGDVSSGSSDVAVVGMDSNTLPESSTVRFLKGLEPFGERSTWFVDAWTAGDGPGFTSDPSNPYAALTAGEVGIRDPRLLPCRRIDYLFVRGYVYGRPGCPLSTSLVGVDPAPSDHYGVRSELWMPPL